MSNTSCYGVLTGSCCLFLQQRHGAVAGTRRYLISLVADKTTNARASLCRTWYIFGLVLKRPNTTTSVINMIVAFLEVSLLILTLKSATISRGSRKFPDQEPPSSSSTQPALGETGLTVFGIDASSNDLGGDEAIQLSYYSDRLCLMVARKAIETTVGLTRRVMIPIKGIFVGSCCQHFASVLSG